MTPAYKDLNFLLFISLKYPENSVRIQTRWAPLKQRSLKAAGEQNISGKDSENKLTSVGTARVKCKFILPKAL